MWSRPGRQAEAASALTNKPNHQNESKSMNNKFDELTKSMAQSVTRRAALKKFGVGLAGMALAGILVTPTVTSAASLGPLIELSRPNAVGSCDDHFVTLPGT